ncbi:5-dehydro-2-deoxygluconokinase [Delftia tsuruhatensis]|uniref:carbohydrate kinase family protein n=1 Tax=Delftia tsuruhatensis TaxID=180282 RepID=UPI001E73DB31|nr:carbohydrate kinase [Delftia tsuruhatensis]CAB5664722.1 5-dehydro-2-deoxygluconokinase [Delftia tsuruhatensis]CAC9677456.1 5-dehydro-2-deoxygluconokinase [Delftia tsuruhatensis]
MRIAVVGEALIDFTATGGLAFQGHEGGAPANCAVAAARLGQATGLVSQLSRDLFGERLFAHLQRNGVDMHLVQRCDAPSTLAFVERGQDTNRYAFYMQGTADTLWAPAELPELPPQCRYLQFGSIALLRAPAGPRILDLVAAQRGRRIIAFDPNVRPTLIGDAGAFRRDCMAWGGLADLVKLSEEDMAFLTPGVPVLEAATHWLAQGARAVVLTRGAAGATLLRAGRVPLSVRPPEVALVDTIGAGDTFGAALSVALLEQGAVQACHLQELPDIVWRRVLRFAATAAALNCTRAGAQPPWRAELDALLAAQPHE